MTDYQERASVPEKIQKEFAHFSGLLQKLLFSRGIEKAEDAEGFVNPRYEESLHDPFLLKGMEKAVERILKAIKKEEKIVIYSDFDADGIPGAVVLSDFFKKIEYANYSVSIPHRNTEGFGLNSDAIDRFARDEVNLIITIDCGMGDGEHVAQANEAGIDVIVTDHHRPNHHVPEAVAIVNPNQDGDDYPNKALCGAGVIFKVVQALIQKGDFDISEGWDKWLLDMVGIATLSDMVALAGENRALAYYGLKVLRKSRRIGLQGLLRKARVNQKYLTEDDVAFMVTPRINAASRMDEPETAFRLLSTDDEAEAEELVNHLDELNNKRKGAVAVMSKEIHKTVSARPELPEVLVIGNTHWKPGLLGLAATKAVELYKRPVFVWGRGSASVIKGSARSYNDVDLVALMERANTNPDSQKAGDTFLEYGGHTKSGGFSATVEQVVYLEERLNKAYVSDPTSSSHEDDRASVDAKLTLDDVSWNTHDELAKLQPFGMENPKPVFLFEKVVVEKTDRFGKEKNHLKFIFGNSTGNPISAIQFFFDEEGELARVEAGQAINLLAHVEKSVFGGRPEVRLRIVDML